MNEITPQDFGWGLGRFLVEVGKILAALSIAGGALWFAFQPRVEGWLEEWLDQQDAARNTAVFSRFESLDAQLDVIIRAIGSTRAAFIEFRGTGVVQNEGPISPGDIVTIHFQLRRNVPCPTSVEVRFFSADLNAIDSSLTYIIPATRAPVTSDFMSFTVRLRLPADMPPGRYAYAPVLVPEGCNNYGPETPPMSEFFNVG